jgi:hypothetical protein
LTKADLVILLPQYAQELHEIVSNRFERDLNSLEPTKMVLPFEMTKQYVIKGSRRTRKKKGKE